MRRLALSVILVATLLVPAIAGAQESESDTVRIQQVTVQDYPTVRMLVTVPSPTTLSAADFAVSEAGEEITVDEAVPVDEGSILSVLVIDTSGSMRGQPLASAKDAALAFLDELPGGASVAVVAFGDTAQVVSGLGTDRAATTAAIEGLIADGETALFDGVVLASGLLPGGTSAAKSIVALTDGADTASTATADDAVSAITGRQADFYAIELETPDTESGPLESIADGTNGVLVPADDPEALQDIYATIGTAIASQYVVSYTSQTSGPVGVSVAVSGLGASPEFPVRLPTTGGGGGPASSTTLPTTTTTEGLALTEPEVYAIGDSVFAGPIWLWLGVGLFFVGLVGMLGYLFAAGGSSAASVRPTFRSRGSRALSGVSAGLVSAAERAGGESNRGIDASLERAGLSLRAGEYLVITAALALLFLAIGWTFGNFLIGLIAALVVVAVLASLPGVLGDRRQRAFEDALPDTLTMLASTIRTGYAPIQATELVAREVGEPTTTELMRSVAETRLGRDYVEALRGVANRLRSDDFGWVVDAMEINRTTGGNIAEILDSVAGTIRSRIQLRREVSALTAEGRLSAVILVAVPFLMAGWLYVRDPEYLRPLVETTTGLVMTIGSAVLMVIGIIVLRRMIKIEE